MEGRLRLLAVSSARRLPQFPDAQTLGESGIPGEIQRWAGVVKSTGVVLD